MPPNITLAGEGRSWKLSGPGGVELCVENLREARPAEVALLPHLPALTGRVVIPHTGGSPLVPAVIAGLNPTASIEVVELDLHDARLLREKLAPLRNIRVLCAADAGPVDSAQQSGVLLLDERTDRLLAFDFIERLDHILPAGSTVLALMPKKRAPDFARKLEQHFLKRYSLPSRHGVTIMRGVAGGAPAAWTPREHVFEASTPTEKIRVVTRPGVFAHTRADSGGLALAESFQPEVGAAKPCGDLSEARQGFAAPTEKSHPRILELGCGCGLVGLLLAARWRNMAVAVDPEKIMGGIRVPRVASGVSPDVASGQESATVAARRDAAPGMRDACATHRVEFVLVDSNARAVDCARRGVELNGFGGIHIEHADVFQPEAGAFDAVLGNPPYFAQRRIADYFIEVAAGALRPGGALWLVSKHGDEIERLAAAQHFHVETRQRRGYDISICRK
jgi:16S rRNA G1207 methylase RsmC